MIPEIYWIESVPQGRLAVMPKPRGNDWLEDEIIGFKHMGVDTTVSFLQSQEEGSLGLSLEREFCQKYEIEFLSFPIEDRCLPDSTPKAIQFISELHNRLLQNKSIAIHCRAGIGRSGLAAASLLVKFGFSTESAFTLVSEARGINVPDTQEQYNWVKQFEDSLIS